MNPEDKRGPDKGPIIGAAVLIAAGTVLLVEKLGLLPPGFALHFWPSILILIGLVKIAVRAGRPTGAVLIGVGVFLQLSEMGILHVNFWDLWPIFIIVAGVAMLWQALSKESPALSMSPRADVVYIFGGGDRKINAKDFQRASLFAMFGGYKLDLRNADIAGNEAVVEASAIFGGGEIRVPENWVVSLQGAGIFGAYEDKTQHVQTDPSRPTKTLVVKGIAIFGGIEVKN